MALAHTIVRSGEYHRDFVREWVNVTAERGECPENVSFDERILSDDPDLTENLW